MTSSKRSVEKIIQLLAKYMDEMGIDYVIVSGIAVIAWGRPRTTQDIDIIIDHGI